MSGPSVCMCVTERDILCFCNPQAFNLLFLNLPLLSVSRALDSKVSEHQGALAHPHVARTVWCNSLEGEVRAQTHTHTSDKMMEPEPGEEEAPVSFPSACHSTRILVQLNLRSPVI